jgi:glycerophosphoryl diester phosphodiesterase
LPLLDDLVARYGSRAFLDIELKVPGLESCLLKSISHFPPQRGFVVSSFLPDILLDMRARSGSIPLGIICETRKQLQRWPELPLDYVMVKEPLITRDLIEKVHAAEKRILAWTINRNSSMLRLAKWRIDGIISDQPDLLFNTLRGNQRR